MCKMLVIAQFYITPKTPDSDTAMTKSVEALQVALASQNICIFQKLAVKVLIPLDLGLSPGNNI